MGEVIKHTDSKEASVQTKISKETFKDIFRVIFAGDNALLELYPKSVLVGIDDLKLLNKQLEEKLSRSDSNPIVFSAIASYENGRSEEYGSWERFNNDDWPSPDVLGSLSLTWKFMLTLTDEIKPKLHNINIRIASTISSFHVMQAIFSKDPEEIDRIDLKMVTMIARIEFTDHILSQELLDLISKWNKGLRSPEYIFPFMQRIKANSEKIRYAIRHSIPLFSAIACFGYYYNYSQKIVQNAPVTGEIFTETIMWLVVSAVILFLSNILGKVLGRYSDMHLKSFGKFTAIELTKGDRNRQTELQAKNSNSFYKFFAYSIFALLWNIIGGVIAALLMQQ